jgi:hypothetical protein
MKSPLYSFVLQFAISASALAAAILFVVTAAAWTGPTAAPPNGDVPPPLNAGPVGQVKQGGLGVTNLVADQMCFGADCRTGWSGTANGSAPELIWSGSLGDSASNSLISGKHFSDYASLAFIASGMGSFQDVATVSYSLFIAKSSKFLGMETFSGDDSGHIGVKYIDDTHFATDSDRGGTLVEIWGLR